MWCSPPSIMMDFPCLTQNIQIIKSPILNALFHQIQSQTSQKKYLKRLENKDYGQGLIYGITSGSVQEKFNKTAFRDLSINYPNIEYIKRFGTQVKTYFEKIDFNRSQIHTLEKLRDTLLPKLMSGEVRVKSEQQEADT